MRVQVFLILAILVILRTMMTISSNFACIYDLKFMMETEIILLQIDFLT